MQQEAAKERVYAGVFAFSVSWPREGRQSLTWKRRTPLRENLAAATPTYWIHMPHRGRQRSRRSRSLHISSTGRTNEQPLRRSLESNPRPKASVRSINGVGKTNARPVRRSLDFRPRPTASILGNTHPRIGSSSLCNKETVLSCDTIPCAIYADPMRPSSDVDFREVGFLFPLATGSQTFQWDSRSSFCGHAFQAEVFAVLSVPLAWSELLSEHCSVAASALVRWCMLIFHCFPVDVFTT